MWELGWQLNFFVLVPVTLQVWFSTCTLHLQRFVRRLQLGLGSNVDSAVHNGAVYGILISMAGTENAAMAFPPESELHWNSRKSAVFAFL